MSTIREAKKSGRKVGVSFREVWEEIFLNIGVLFSLWRASDHVSEYEEVECMTRVQLRPYHFQF